jgi:hypothetical protein
MSDNKDREFEFIASQTPTSATDVINVAEADNGRLLLQMVSVVPDYIIENHRTVLSSDNVKPFIDIICEVANYYPKKPVKKAVKKPASKKKAASKKSNT